MIPSIQNHLARRLTGHRPIPFTPGLEAVYQSLHSPRPGLPTNRQSGQTAGGKKPVPFTPVACRNMEGPSDCIRCHYSAVFSTFPCVIIFLSLPPLSRRPIISRVFRGSMPATPRNTMLDRLGLRANLCLFHDEGATSERSRAFLTANT